MQTFLWHDYETFGADPKKDRPAQFAAIRTDGQLNEIEEPLEIYCKPSFDYLPAAQACLITGITPQIAYAKGVSEAEFAQRLNQAFSVPETIGVGYNTIRFDDEVTRFLFWRNLIDPYAREWRNGNGRWDLLDVVRMTYALRPDGIHWPKGQDDRVSFRLELLSKANGLLHEAAHDAVSDVRATIALARLIRQTQPKLFDFALQLRDKRFVAHELGLPTELATAKPFVHISGMFPVEQGCMTVMLPIAAHPDNRNEILAWDLMFDPSELADLTVEQVKERLFTRAADLPQGMSRLALKSIHLNKSPMVVGNLKVLTPQVIERWSLDIEKINLHWAKAKALPDLSALWHEVFARKKSSKLAIDPEQDLYGGFVGDEDRKRLNEAQAMRPEILAAQKWEFSDPRLPELIWRYRARNFPHTLTEDEQRRWEEHRKAVLIDGYGENRTATDLMTEIDVLSETANEDQHEILGALYDWADQIVPDA